MKRITWKITVILMVLLIVLMTAVSCGNKIDFKVDFIVDDAVYATIKTNGEEVLKMPNDPVKEGVVFDGWFWDKDSWQKPFTANSLLDAPLSSNMAVYAKWVTPEHITGTQAEFSGFNKVSETEYSMKVSNTTTSISLGTMVTVGSHSAWTLSSDIYGNKTIASKTATLEIGDNTYYVLVSNDRGNVQLYTLKIRRRPTYTVDFDTSGGTVVDSQKVEEDSFAKVPVTERTGYHFVSWSVDFSTPITENQTAVALWKANTNQIKLNANGGTADETELMVTYDEAYRLPTPERTGYTFAGWYGANGKVTDGTWNGLEDIELTAKWTAVPYRIEYDLNGGTGSKENPTGYTVEDEIELIAPTRRGYTFIGWTGTGLTAPTMTVSISAGSIGDRTYRANWKANTNQIKLNANGGTADETELMVTYDEAYRLPTPERTGYTFAGWYGANGKVTDGTWNGLEDIELTAKWEIIQYRIDYDVDGGTNSSRNPKIYTVSDSFVLGNPTRKGYTFIGWTGTGLSEMSLSVTIDCGTVGNRNYQAHWKANTYKVTFVTNGAKESLDAMNVQYDAFTLLPTVTRTGYSFVGWYACTVQYTDGVWKTTSDLELTAMWTANSYTVTYQDIVKSADGYHYSYGNAYSSTFTFDDVCKMPMPHRVGYTFIGWYSGDEKVESDYWDFDYDVVLTPSWQANTYTITLNPNGGTVTPSSVSVKYDGAYNLPTPTKTGYLFTGWYSEGVKYSSGVWTIPNGISLMARWTPRTDIPYVVNHYLQNIEDDDYTLLTENIQYFSGTADSKITPSVNSYVGFKSPSAQTVTVAPDGSLVVNYYYTRNYYKISMVTNGGERLADITLKYRAPIHLPTPVRDGYTFGGWFTKETLVKAFEEAVIGADNVTVYVWWSEENKPTDFTYSGTGAVTISAYNGASTTMWIPTYIGGVPVTTISASAFENKIVLSKVVVPDTVISIGSKAFKGCNAIEDITLPAVNGYFGSIFGMNNKYGDYATSSGYGTSPGSGYCYNIPVSIRKVTITRQTEIPKNAFRNCDLIEEIHIPQSTTKIGSYAFYHCKNLSKLNSVEDGTYHLPEQVTQIESYCFSYNKLLQKLSFGELTSVGAYAFQNCGMLQSFEEMALQAVGEYAFSGCAMLQSFKSTVLQKIGEYAFSGCVMLESVQTGDVLQTIGQYAFNDCILLSRFNSSANGKFIIPDGVTRIDNGAFKGCNLVDDITLPFVGNTVSSSYEYAVFGYIFGMETKQGSNTTCQYSRYWKNEYGGGSGTTYFYYFIPKTITNITITLQLTIPDYAFMNCSWVKKINLPKESTATGENTFTNCTAIISYTAKSSVWNGDAVAKAFAGGSGTADNPYVIATAEQLALLAAQVKAGNRYNGVYFVLSEDLNLGAHALVIGDKSNAFYGVFDGEGHSIYNYRISEKDETLGLFAYNAGIIRRLTVKLCNANVTSDLMKDVVFGGIAAYNSGTIENCFVNGTFALQCTYKVITGGVAGVNSGIIRNCLADGVIMCSDTNFKAYAGGIAGQNTGNISGCVVYNSVLAKGMSDGLSYVGSIAGESTGDISSCYRVDRQELTKFDTPYDEVGAQSAAATESEIISFCKANWDDVWDYSTHRPTLK